MDPDQLWETTLNPETRILKQVEIEDAKASTELQHYGYWMSPPEENLYRHASLMKLVCVKAKGVENG